MKVDNFALQTHQRCPAEWKLRIEEGWTSRGRSPALRFGIALHAALAEWYRGKGLELSLEAIARNWDTSWDAPDDYRTLEKCARTFLNYVKTYPSETFKIVGAPEVPIVEQAFSLETGMHCGCVQCGYWPEDATQASCPRCHSPLEPIEYGGILDTLVEVNGIMYVLDHKTTSVFGSTYFHQFKPDNQMTGYIWAGSKMSGGRVAGAIVNAIAVTRAGADRFGREITSRNSLDIEEWLTSLRVECTDIMRHRAQGLFPMRTTACITKYGKCQFHSVHVLSQPEDRVRRLEQDYVVEPWDYEKRDVADGATTVAE